MRLHDTTTTKVTKKESEPTEFEDDNTTPKRETCPRKTTSRKVQRNRKTNVASDQNKVGYGQVCFATLLRLTRLQFVTIRVRSFPHKGIGRFSLPPRMSEMAAQWTLALRRTFCLLFFLMPSMKKLRFLYCWSRLACQLYLKNQIWRENYAIAISDSLWHFNKFLCVAALSIVRLYLLFGDVT